MSPDTAAPVLFGLAAEIAAVRDAVLDPQLRGALVLGGEGAGKTALAEEVIRRLGEDTTVYRVHAGPALSTVPYAVLAPYLGDPDPAPSVAAPRRGDSPDETSVAAPFSAEVSAEDIQSPLRVLRLIREYFRTGRSQGRALLVVDDAQDLDAATSHILGQLAMSAEVSLLVLARGGAGQMADLLSLSHDGLLARVDLKPLSGRDIDQMCRELLGGTVASAVGGLLTRMSGGNPLYTRAMLTSMRRLGYIYQRNGVWLLHEWPAQADPALVDLVKHDLFRRPDAERRVLETVALAEGVPPAILSMVAEAAAVRALLDAGTLWLRPAGATGPELVALPVDEHARIIARLVPAGRSAQIRGRLLEALAAQSAPGAAAAGWPHSPGALSRHIGWALDCGDAVPDALLLAAARAANAAGDTGLALRCAAAVADTGAAAAVPAALESAFARLQRGDFAAAALLLDGALDAAPDPAVLRRAGTVTARLIHRTGGPQQLRGLAGRWEQAATALAGPPAESLTPIPAGPPVESLTQALADTPAGPALLRVLALNLEGGYARAEEQLRSLPAAGGCDAEDELVAQALLGEALGAAGRFTEAAAATARALALLADNNLGEYRGFVLVRHAYSLLHAGRYEDLEHFMDGFTTGCGEQLVYLGGAVDTLRGAADIHRGWLHTGLDRLRPAVEALRGSDPELLLPYALGLAAHAAATLGDHDLAARYVADYQRVPYPGPRQLRLSAQGYIAGADPAALRALAEQARGEGIHSAEKDLLELLLGLGDESMLQRFGELTGSLEGTEAYCLHLYAAALAAADPDLLLAAGDEATRHSKFLTASACMDHAIRISGSDVRRQRSLMRRRRQLQEPAGPEPAAQPAVKLTKREHEIVARLLAGATAKEIAGSLTLAQRTVEGHIYRIYLKLGISSRKELPAAYRDVAGDRAKESAWDRGPGPARAAVQGQKAGRAPGAGGHPSSPVRKVSRSDGGRV